MIDVRLVQLLDAAGQPYDFTVAGDARTYADLATPAGLAWIAGYADGIGVNKNLIVPRDAAGKLLAPTTLIRDAHREKLVVHAWTFRAENQFLPVDFPGSAPTRTPGATSPPSTSSSSASAWTAPSPTSPRRRRRRQRGPGHPLIAALDLRGSVHRAVQIGGRWVVWSRPLELMS